MQLRHFVSALFHRSRRTTFAEREINPGDVIGLLIDLVNFIMLLLLLFCGKKCVD